MLKRFVSALCQRFPANEGAGERQLSSFSTVHPVSAVSPNLQAKTLSQASATTQLISSKTSSSHPSSKTTNQSSKCKSKPAKRKSANRKSRRNSSKHYKASKSYNESKSAVARASISCKLVESRITRALKHDVVTAQDPFAPTSSSMNFGGEALPLHSQATSAKANAFVPAVQACSISDVAGAASEHACSISDAAGAASEQAYTEREATVGASAQSCAGNDAAVAASAQACGGKGSAGNWFKASMYAAMIGCAAVAVSSCSTSEELPEHEVLVEDPISFKVEGISGELNTNVNAHLGALAVIPKKRAVFYVREIKEVTAKALRAYGYYHPKIKVVLPDAKNKADTTVRVQVEEGKPLYIRQSKIEILGEGVKYKVFADLLKNTQLGSYSILNHGVYEDLKNAIHTTALSMGFFDGKFTSKRILVYQDQNFADIELIYDSGTRYTFGELLMNDETKDLYQPSMPLQNFEQGQKFNTKTINSFVSSLNQTGYYNAVDVRPVLDKAHDFQVPIEMNLERRPNNNMRVGLGYTTDEGARILLEWNKPLLNARGDSLSTLATLTQVSQDAQIVYKIPRDNPNLDYYTINLAQTHTDFNDTLSDRSQIAFHYIANETGNWRRDYALRVEYEDFNQADEEGYALNFMPAVMLSRRESSGGYDPKRGYSLSLEALGTPGGISDNKFMQVKATYKGVLALSENTRFLFRLEQGANFGPDADNVPPSLRFFAGGDNSIRGFGYRDRSTHQPWGGLKGAKYLTTGSAELQFPMGISNSRLAIFCDAGTATDDYKDEIMYGPGIGYRFLSPYGIVRVDLAMGLQKNEENIYQLHFAFGPEF